jgi:hypothetical protein
MVTVGRGIVCNSVRVDGFRTSSRCLAAWSEMRYGYEKAIASGGVDHGIGGLSGNGFPLVSMNSVDARN